MTQKLAGWGRQSSPFHEGERELHRRLGIEERQEGIGRLIMRPYMPEQHQQFFASLPFIVIGSVDSDGNPWSSIMFGKPGFLEVKSERTLRINAKPMVNDPLVENIQLGNSISIVGVELETRRRNRINATVTEVSEDGFAVSVNMSFGNCHQYIQTREHYVMPDSEITAASTVEKFTILPPDISSAIRRADTFFVASHNPVHDQHDTGGVDVNHRGGMPGFIRQEGNVLTIPDYKGNRVFNTLGNFLINPKAGLLFVNFDSRDIIQLIGKAEIFWEKTAEIKTFEGAERSWTFTIEKGQILREAAPITWAFQEFSPKSEATGNW